MAGVVDVKAGRKGVYADVSMTNGNANRPEKSFPETIATAKGLNGEVKFRMYIESVNSEVSISPPITGTMGLKSNHGSITIGEPSINDSMKNYMIHPTDSRIKTRNTKEAQQRWKKGL